MKNAGKFNTIRLEKYLDIWINFIQQDFFSLM